MGLKSRINWLLRARIIAKKHSGFWAGFRTYADNKCLFSDNVHLYRNTTLYNVKIEKHTYLAGTSSQHATFGKFCSVAPNTIVGGLGAHPTNQVSTHPVFYSTGMQSGKTFAEKNYFQENKETIVKNDVWIGSNAIILDGLTIGNGSIVAAGAIVTKSVPDYAIVAGVPAKIIRFRYDEKIITALNTLEWWQLDDVILKQLAPIFRDNDITRLIREINKIK